MAPRARDRRRRLARVALQTGFAQASCQIRGPKNCRTRPTGVGRKQQAGSHIRGNHRPQPPGIGGRPHQNPPKCDARRRRRPAIGRERTDRVDEVAISTPVKPHRTALFFSRRGRIRTVVAFFGPRPMLRVYSARHDTRFTSHNSATRLRMIATKLNRTIRRSRDIYASVTPGFGNALAVRALLRVC
jgi:hypothetical protein